MHRGEARASELKKTSQVIPRVSQDWKITEFRTKKIYSSERGHRRYFQCYCGRLRCWWKTRLSMSTFSVRYRIASISLQPRVDLSESSLLSFYATYWNVTWPNTVEVDQTWGSGAGRSSAHSDNGWGNWAWVTQASGPITGFITHCVTLGKPLNLPRLFFSSQVHKR